MSLIDTSWLENNIDKVKIIDCSWHMPQTQRNGFEEYTEEHIPNAIFFDLDKNSKLDTDLPHMLTDTKSWEKIMSNMGIENNDRIVVYDNSDVISSCRCWYNLIYYGHDPNLVHVLDGGLKKWKKENKSTDNKEVITKTSKYTCKENKELVKNKKKYMFRIKDECIANRGNVNLNGDDFKHPSILKEDKTGLINEDKGSLFKHITNNDVNTENKDINENLNEEEILGYLVLIKNKITLLIEKKNLSSFSIKEVKDISNLISKVKSFPDYPKYKYKKLHKQNNVLSSLFLEMLEKDKRAEIIPIRNKFGLGWINQPYNNLDPFNEKINHLLIDNSDYSQFHFFYINNNGVLNPKTNTNYKLDFKKVLYPDYYTLQNSEDKKYCKIEDNKIIFTNPPDLQKDISENINYMFKLKLNGSESDNIFIQPYDNKNGNENKYLVFDNYNISKLQLINDPLNNKENSKTFVIN